MNYETFHIVENLDDSYGGPAKSITFLAKNLRDLKINQTLVSVRYNDYESNRSCQRYHLSWKSFNFNYFKKSRYSNELKHFLKQEYLLNQKN